MPKDFGVIRPDRLGRWKWPLGEMQDGDCFTVLPQERTIESVRNTVKCAGYKWRKRFSCRMIDGVIKVQLVTPKMAQISEMPETLPWQTFIEQYRSITKKRGTVRDPIPWHLMDKPGDKVAVPYEPKRLMELPDYVVQVAQHRYHVNFGISKLSVAMVHPAMTQYELMETLELMS